MHLGSVLTHTERLFSQSLGLKSLVAFLSSMSERQGLKPVVFGPDVCVRCPQIIA